jgi:ribosomal protein L31
MIMTKFNKEMFRWDGSYLMYAGSFDGAKMMQDVRPDCHPSWIGKLKPAFVARFKYGYKPYKAWINFLVNNVTVEQYMDLANSTSPAQAMVTLGYKGKL